MAQRRIKAGKTLHHRMGGSTTKRYFHCAISIVLTEWARKLSLIPQENRSSEPARLGSAAHTLGEKCLETGCDPIDYLNTQIIIEGKKYMVDAHMVEGVTIYVDACREQAELVNADYQAIEFNSELAHLFDGEDVGGPCDFVCCGSGILVIMDYKNGTYPVEIKGNTQFFKYALGMYEELKKKYEIRTIRTIVIQPNCHHIDGPVRSHDYTIRELKRWKRKDLGPAVRRVAQATELVDNADHALRVLETGERILYHEELGPNAEHDACHFCPVAGVCKKYKELNQELIKHDFSDDVPLMLPTPNELTVEEAERIILARGSITKWLEEVYNYRKHALQQGLDSNNFKIVESLGNRAWQDEQKVIRKIGRMIGRDNVYEKKIYSPAALEKAVYTEMKKRNPKFTQKDAKNLIDTYTFRPPRGLSMVAIKDGRESSLITARDDFAEDITAAKKRKRRSKR